MSMTTTPAFNHVDFSAVKEASSRQIEMVVRHWLPDGRREGNEWVARNPTRNDARPGSFKINLRTGAWGDFATSDKGGDMIDLCAYLHRTDPLDAARCVGELCGVQTELRTAQIHTLPVVKRVNSAVLAPSDLVHDPESFPPRTVPDGEGKPRFIAGGEDGPPRWGNEIRRHFYKIGTTAVRVKIMRSGNYRAVTWYRVSDGKLSGWQSAKPDGYQSVPYLGVRDAFDADPFGADQIGKPLWWPEGERDVESIADKGGLAFSFGGCGDGLPEGCEEYARGRDLIILADNDEAGVKHANKKAALAAPIAKSIRVVHFPDLQPEGDVSDFFQQGGTFAQLQNIAASTNLYQLPTGEASSVLPAAPARIKATPYMWVEPESIPKRDFVYGRHLIRKFVSATIAPGGVGKSSLIATEALAMVSGVDLLGVAPHGRSRVWLWNLEDPQEEIARHIQATAKHFNLTARDIEGHLWVDSGRDQSLVTAINTRDGVVIQEPVIANLVAEIKERRIDALVVDPFVSSHQATENDNPAMDRIVKAWGRVAQQGNCAIELIHHARKSSAGDIEITVESSRGGKALTDGCRSVRVLNRMSKDEGENAAVDNPRVHFRTYIDKSNLAPPAESSDWFKLESVELGNGVAGGYGDNIGVVVPWQWPDLMAGVSVNDLRAVQKKIASGRYRASPQADDWVGKAVSEALRIDLGKPNDKRRIINLLKVWLSSGALQKVEEKDDKGMSRPFIVVGEWAND